ncbi:MAG TPA: bifunctional transaldolase/phosoglucose isomerase [Pyrinomonadaceae bacterium]|nr:bifunctional transaldolase/phosoglucose isomerase [Pyrinomonadaceae bacterium]
MAAGINPQSFSLTRSLKEAASATLEEWAASDKVSRLWARDASLWTGADEADWLGWLSIVSEQKKNATRFAKFAEEVADIGFSHVLLLGMGGSSLCPEVFRKTFGKIEGFPELHVLDSTDPAQIKSIETKIDLSNTLFFVSSKSGTTLEPNIFKQYFFERVRQTVGDKAGDRFIAITDPGSKLRQTAEHDQFRKIFLGVPSIGGRYSALSDFGLAPAAAMGVDVPKFLDRTSEMVAACGPEVSARNNPGVILGAILGVAHNNGRDKVTIIASPGIYDLGAWLEQLIAESTGKNGKGLIPVDRESLSSPETYGDDRMFVYLRLAGDTDASLDVSVDALEDAGQPVVRISVGDVYNLGQEFFRWEIATAVAGSIIGINPFNQPDVEASKVATRKLTEQYEQAGSLPAETPFFEADGVKLFADERNAKNLNDKVKDRSLSGYLRAHLDRVQDGDYFALLAYLEMNDAHESVLRSTRHAVRDRKHVATCLGFGPRFLHSTGQTYKGGPNTGVFLQITCDDAIDLPVPGQKYTFGIVKAAQARGDFEVLAERGRRALRVHLGADVSAGLAQLQEAVRAALQ